MISVLFAFTPVAPWETVVIVLGVVAALVILWLVACVLIANKTLNMASKPVAHTLEEARETQARVENVDFTDYDSNWKKREFELDGMHGKLRGEIVFNDGAKISRNKVAVICHGHTWNRINSLKYAQIFYDKGYNLVLYDHSYFGKSDGEFCTLGYYEKHDLSTVIDYAFQVFGENAFVALHGESMGAVTVLSLLGLRKDVGLVVADCPFSNTGMYYREFFEHLFGLSSFPVVEFSNALSKRRYGYDFDKCNPIDDVRASDVPICFIHGKKDDFIYPHHSEDMYAVCRNAASELHLVEDAGHARSYFVNHDAYREIVGGFIDKIEAQSL